MGASLFYERLIHLCELHNEKPTPLLNNLNLSSGNIKRWKNGSSVNFKTVLTLAEYFDVSLDYLLGRTNFKTQDPSINVVCDITGLSEKSVLMLTRLKKENFFRLGIINLLLEQSDDDIEVDYFNFDGVYEGSVLNAVCRYLDGTADRLLSMEFDDYEADRIRYARIRSAVRRLIFDQAVEAIKAFDEPKTCHP